MARSSKAWSPTPRPRGRRHGLGFGLQTDADGRQHRLAKLRCRCDEPLVRRLCPVELAHQLSVIRGLRRRRAPDPDAEGRDGRVARVTIKKSQDTRCGAFARNPEPVQHAIHHAIAAGEMELVGVRRIGIQGANDHLLQAQARAMKPRLDGFFGNVQTQRRFRRRSSVPPRATRTRSGTRRAARRWRAPKRRAAAGRSLLVPDYGATRATRRVDC